MLAGARVMQVPRPLARFRLHEQQRNPRTRPRPRAEMARSFARRSLRLDSPIRARARARIIAQINYDMYQLAPPPKPSFAKALFRNPSWLRAPAARRRLLGSMGLSGSQEKP